MAEKMDFRKEIVDVAIERFEKSSLYTYSDGLHVLSIGKAEGPGMTVTISTVSKYGKGYAIERETVVIPTDEIEQMAKSIIGRNTDD